MFGQRQRRAQGFLLVDHNEVVDVGAEVFREALSAQGLRGRDPSLIKVEYEHATPDGVIEDATLYFTVAFAFPSSVPTHFSMTGMPTGRRARVTVPIQIREGKFRIPQYFITSSGTKYALTQYGLSEWLPLHPGPLIRKRAPRATISRAPEGDYRAF